MALLLFLPTFWGQIKIKIILERDTDELQPCQHDNGIILDLIYDTLIQA